METIEVFLDTDCIVNVLCEEIEPETGKKLWLAPKEILNLISDEKLTGMTSLINLMEIRSVLSLKKRWKKEDIFKREDELKRYIQIVIPEFMDHLDADEIQRKLWLTPIDSLILALARKENSTLISRDRSLGQYADVLTPEQFLEKHFPQIFEEIESEE